MFKLNIVFAVIFGASLGALLRWWLSVKFNNSHESFFLGTLLANVIACFLMGLLIGYESSGNTLSHALRIAIFSGFLGSLSTFSSFIAETYSHLLIKDWLKLLLGFNLQIILGLLAFHLAKQLGGIWQ